MARAFSSDLPKLQEIIIAANAHQGISVIDVLQPCFVLNKDYTNKFFQENCYQLGADHDKSDKVEAFKKSLEWGEKQIPLGIFFQEEKPSYESQIKTSREGNLAELFKKYM